MENTNNNMHLGQKSGELSGNPVQSMQNQQAPRAQGMEVPTEAQMPEPKKVNKLSIIIVLLVIVLAIFLYRNTTRPVEPLNSNNGQNNSFITNIRPIDPNEHIFGNPNADVFVVEYSDLECPFCKMFHVTMHQIIEENDGEVAWVYRHFPIEQLHSKAFGESLASECASEQGGNDLFWAYIDEIYARTNSNNTLPLDEPEKIAQEFGLNMAQFAECVNSGKYNDKIDQDLTDGRVAGVSGTPTSYIVVDGVVVDTIPGASPIENVRAKVEQALKQ